MIAETEKLEDLELSRRAINGLKALNISGVSELINSDLDKIRHGRNIGEKTFTEIKDLLKKIVRPDFILETPAPLQPIRNLAASMIAETERIENLAVSVRAVKALKKCNICTVSDLKNLDLHKIRWSGGVGKKTFAEIISLLDETVKFKSAPDTPGLNHSVCSVIDAFLLKIKDRDREIFLKRTGLFDGKQETLESIGSRFGLTRERVRQIEEKTRLKLSQLFRGEAKGILDTICKQVRDQTILSSEEIFNICGDLIGGDFKFSKYAVVNLIMGAVGNEVKPVSSSGNLWTVSKLIAGCYPDIVRLARRLLSWLTIDLDSLAIEVSREFGLREKMGVESIKKLLRASTRFLKIVDSNDHESFEGISPKRQSLSSMRKDFGYFYIKREGVAINVQEIFQAMQEEAPRLLPPKVGLSDCIHVLDANLERDKRLAWAGNSFYALVEWGYEHEVKSIDKAIERLLRQMARPMRTDEIRDRILGLYKVSAASISAALSREKGKRFRRISEGTWTLA